MAPTWWSRTLKYGDSGRDVSIVQSILGEYVNGHYTAEMLLLIRGFQKGSGLVVTGLVDEETATALGEQEGFGLLPSWYQGKSIGPLDPAYDHALSLIGAQDSDGLRRFQGNHRLPATGVVDETTARLLAGLEVT